MTEKILDCLRAKSKEGNNFLLKDHLKEVLLRAIQFQEFVNKNREKISFKFDDEFFKNLAIAMSLHDMGKIDYSFQKKVFCDDEKKNTYKNEWEQIKKFFDTDGQKWKVNVNDHEALSIVYSQLMLRNSDWDAKVRTAILLHHHNSFYVNEIPNFRNILDVYPDIEKYTEFLLSKKDAIKSLLSNLILCLKSDNEIKKSNFVLDILNKLENNVDMNRLDSLSQQISKGYNVSQLIKFHEIDNDKPDHEFLVFLGTLRRCDYSASGKVRIETNKTVSEIFDKLEENIINKIKFQSAKFNLWQKDVLKNLNRQNIVLVAPTGSGKTEFALMWAKDNGKKLLYTLPLRVALNDLFVRFATDEKLPYFGGRGEDVGILHSTAFMEFLKEEKEGEELSVESKLNSSKLFSYPILLSTPDQIFLTSLKYYGSDKVISIYPVSSIVIDEIQAYNPEMAAIIIKTLEIIKSLNGNILVITATFPPYFKPFFEKRNFGEDSVIDLQNEKWINLRNRIKNYNFKRHKIRLNDGTLFSYEQSKENGNFELKINEDSFKEIHKILNEGRDKNVLIIVNNVGKAIELFKRIESDSQNLSVNKGNLHLLHSRLIEKRKNKTIKDVKEKLCTLKNKRENGKLITESDRLVLVSTQIVEASVDVDFDILITEASPIDSQIQRWGRIYRNRDKEGDYKDAAPNVIIFTGTDKGTKAVYDTRVIEKSLEILKRNESVELHYEKEREMIEKTFEEKINGKSLKEIYVEEIEKNLEWLKYFAAEKRSEAQKIFRTIAGLQVVIPDIMSKSENEIERAFGEVINDKNNWKLPWESKDGDSLINKVKEKVGDNNLENKVNKWELLKILYLHSFNLPTFSYEKHRMLTERKDFKGFVVLKIDGIDLKNIEKYGINKIKEINIEGDEIQSNVI